MNDNAPARPVKARITHGAQQRWLEDAHGFLQNGESPAAIDAWLRDEGCPPRLRQELLRQADARHLGEHRRQGLRVLALGLAAIALGGVLAWWALSTLVPPAGGGLHHGGRLLFAGAVTAVVGAMVGLVGVWKMVTGSRVDLFAEMG